MQHKKQILFSLLAVTLILLSRVVPALAHTRVEVGGYTLIVGWVMEPAVVGERNAIFVEILEGETPVVDAESTLDVELLYADRSFRANLIPTDDPGVYTAELFPTVRGQYSVRLFGTLGEMALDETIAPEEVFPASRIQFPEPEPDTRALQQEVAMLTEQLQTARTLGFAGIGLGAVGLLLGGIALFRAARR